MIETDQSNETITGRPDKGFYARMFTLLRDGMRRHRTRCIKLALLGIVETATQVAALLLVIPIVRQVGQSTEISSIGIALNDLSFLQYLAYVVAVAVLLTISIRTKYLAFSSSASLSGDFTADCAVSTMTSVHSKTRALSLSRQSIRRIVNRSLFGAASACGVSFRRVLLALNEALMLAVFVAVLFYLSPIITALVMALSVPPVVLYLRSFPRIANQADETVTYRKHARNETGELIDALESDEQSPEDVGVLVRALFDEGHTGDALSGKLSVRRRMRGSGAFIELITPIAVLIIALIVYFSQSLGLDFAVVLAYYLVLRRAISAATQIADGLVVINRVFPGLRDFDLAASGADLPSSWMTAQERDGSETKPRSG